MKKIILTLLMTVFLVSCASSDTVVEEPVKQEVTVEESTTEEVDAAENEESQVEIEEDQEVKEVADRGIDGSHYINIALGLKDRGFPDHTVKYSEFMDCMSLERNTYYNAAAQMAYNLNYVERGDEAYEIITASFEILNTEGLDNEDYISLAESYLGFCATMPYDSSDSERARQFIIDNIGSEESVEITIGDAHFELYGVKLDHGLHTARVLDIRKAE